MKFHPVLALLVMVLLAAQCSPVPAQAPAESSPHVQIMDAWARPSPMAAGNGAVYLKLINDGGQSDALLSVASNVAEAAELHETKIGENDMMQMSPVASIEVPAGQSVTLEPGGKHIMLIRLKQELKPGQKVPLTLTFENAGPVTVEAEVRDQGATAGMEHP